MPAPTPFTIAVPDTELDDLRSRLLNTRWPDEVEGLNWEAGIPLDVVKTLTTHWATAFNWRALEARLNARPQFKWGYADPDHPGARPLGIHFFQLRGRRAPAGGGGATPPTPRPAPVLMLHGWPGSFLEFEGVIEELTHPSDPALPGLDLVIPSLPGYGFSDAPAVAGWGVRKVARALNALMTTGLGLKAYNVQGGDWGALIGRALGTEWAASAGALHVNMPVARPRLSSPRTILQALNAPLAGVAPVFLTRAEAAGLRSGWNYATAESGYFRLQATRPQTLAYGLTDSPAGLLAWIGEKFGAWTDTAGEAPALPPGATPAERAAGRAAVRAKRLLEVFSLDHLVANVALYWHGRTAASSVRLYRETEVCGDLGWLLGRSVAVPTGVLAMPFELFRPPRAWVAAHYNLARWTPASKGGHFAAMENPGEFVADVRAFFEAHGMGPDIIAGAVLTTVGSLIGGAGLWARGKATRLAAVERVSAADLASSPSPAPPRLLALSGVAAAPSPLACELDGTATIRAALTSFKEELHALYQLPNGRWVREAHTLRASSREAPGWGIGVAGAAGAAGGGGPAAPPPTVLVPVLASSAARSLPLAPVAETHTPAPASPTPLTLFDTFLGRRQVGTRRLEAALVVGTPMTVVGEVVEEAAAAGPGAAAADEATTMRRGRPSQRRRAFTIRPPPPSSGLPYLITTRPLDSVIEGASASAAAAVRVGGATVTAGLAIALLGRAVRGLRRRLVARRAAAARARVAAARARAAAARAACGGGGGEEGGEERDGLSTCVVCLDLPADFCWTGCGHLCACERCAGRTGARCPVCRARGRALKVFRP